jgi:uncharacterized protein with HEPN domain
MPSVPSKNPAQRLQDIPDNIDAIREFVGALDFPAFAADRRTTYAVVRALEIISEAVKRLPSELKDRQRAIDWAAVAAAGNIYRHEYDAVEENLIWHTIQHDLEPLKRAIASELQRLSLP